jgi:DNA-binding transcriptional regulator YdaS (Cro superfamily)
MLKVKAAEMLGVSPARVSQLIRDGHLHPQADGTIAVAEVERCKREAPVHWQSAGMRSGRKSAAQHERERRDSLWYAVASKLRGKGYSQWTHAQVRETWRDFRAAIRAVDPALIED